MLYIFDSAEAAWMFCLGLAGMDKENKFKVTIGVVDADRALVYVIAPQTDNDSARRLALLHGGRVLYSWSGHDACFRLIVAKHAHLMARVRPVADFISKGARPNVQAVGAGV